jgi:hypothetical protein
MTERNSSTELTRWVYCSERVYGLGDALAIS